MGKVFSLLSKRQNEMCVFGFGFYDFRFIDFRFQLSSRGEELYREREIKCELRL